MFSVGQTVLYGANGVCRIEEITTRRVGSSEMEYYVLKPVRSDCSTVFVPTGNETLVSRMRFVKSADEVRAILDDRTFSIDWIDNNILRTIITTFKGGPVGAGTLATAISEDQGTLEEVYEPFLIKEGFILRTQRGRIATELAYHHLGLDSYLAGREDDGTGNLFGS